MERIIHDLQQGSDLWHQFRLDHFGASEAAAMLGLSKKVMRNELLRMKHTGIAKEFSDFVQEKILDRGHEVEALARPIVEDAIGQDLYPATYSYGILSASCDGLTMDGTIAFEHKQFNKALFTAVQNGELPEEYMPQCQQVILVTGATVVKFVCSDGTIDNMAMMDVLPDITWFNRLDAGWAQFRADLDTYVPPKIIQAAVAEPQMALPAVSIQVNGSIALIDNLSVFGDALTAYIERINKSPETDDDFATLEATVKTLKTAEEALDAAELNALAQTDSIDTMRRTVGLYRDLARTNRLTVEKLVKAEKENRRNAIVQEGRLKLVDLVAALNKRLGKPYMPVIAADFNGVVKSLRTMASIQNAVDSELARATIEANMIAGRIQDSLTMLREQASDHIALFADTAQLVLKDPDDLALVIKSRIDKQKADDEKRIADAAAKLVADQAEAAAKAAITLPAPAPVVVLTASQPTQQPNVTVAEAVKPTSLWQAAKDNVLAALDDMTVSEINLVQKEISKIKINRIRRVNA